MRILFLSPNFPPEVNAAASRTYEHCKRWVAAGHQVTVVAPAPNWPVGKLFEGYSNQWRQEEAIDGVHVVRIWTWLHPNKGLLGRLSSFITFMLHAVWEAYWRRRADVVVATSPQFFSGQAGMLTKWLTGMPFVLEIRDIWPESIVAVGAMKRSLAIRAVERLEQWMYRSADHIVTVGDGYASKLQERSVPIEKMSIIPNGVDLDRWQSREPRRQLRNELGGRGRFVCTYVGTVGMAHGLEVILRAAAILKKQNRDDVVFWIVGDGAQREHLQNEVDRQQLDNVRVTGQVSKDKVAHIIASSDACLVHLRDTQLFGTVIPSKIFEIMAMERPIIMGVRGPALDVVLEASSGVAMTPEDELNLLECIERVRTEPVRYAKGRDYVKANFHRDQFAAEMLGVLDAVATGRSVETSASHESEDQTRELTTRAKAA